MTKYSSVCVDFLVMVRSIGVSEVGKIIDGWKTLHYTLYHQREWSMLINVFNNKY